MEQKAEINQEHLAELRRLGYCYTIPGSKLDQSMEALVAEKLAKKVKSGIKGSNKYEPR